MTPRKMKQNAFLIFMRQANPVKQFNEIGTCLKDGRRSLVLKSVQSMKSMKSEESAEKSMQSQQSEKSEPRYSFLSQPVCSRAWRFFTGIGKSTWHRVAGMVKRGVQSYETKSSERAAPRRKEMEHAIWMVVQDLHHQSPYARKKDPENDPKKWQIPFHQKVCLWRLVKKLHASRQNDPSKPAIFTLGDPKVGTFKRVIHSPVFKEVLVFHRIVDIGRCPKCQYFEWKCSSVPLELRGPWQDALAKHHVIQIEQKRCYAADRARAASQYPHIELYMAITCSVIALAHLPFQPLHESI